MSLLAKTDYFNLGGTGWVVESNSENRSLGYTAEAQGNDGFLVAIDTPSVDILAPQCSYVATGNATLSAITLGSVREVGGKKIALGSVSITTAAGQAPTMQASGSQIEDGGTAKCVCTLRGITVSGLFHAQTFGLFSVSNGQLTNSTLTIDGEIATAVVDGVIRASDLVGGRVTVSGTIVGVNDSGVISTPTITLASPSGNVLAGVLT